MSMRISLRAKKLRARRRRHKTLKKLREHYVAATSKEEKDKILAKVKKISPWLSTEEFLVTTSSQLVKQSKAKSNTS